VATWLPGHAMIDLGMGMHCIRCMRVMTAYARVGHALASNMGMGIDHLPACSLALALAAE